MQVIEHKDAAKTKPLNITINPQQSRYKATANRNIVSLNRGAPLTGEPIRLGLTPTASNPNVKIGAVSINPASVKLLENGGFRLERSGENEWTIFLAEGKKPSNSSYRIGLQLWPEGAYKIEDGRPTAIGTGKSASKPVTISVTVRLLP